MPDEAGAGVGGGEMTRGSFRSRKGGGGDAEGEGCAGALVGGEARCADASNSARASSTSNEGDEGSKGSAGSDEVREDVVPCDVRDEAAAV